MEEIFRFLLLHPPAPATAVDVLASDDFAAALAEAHDAPDSKTALKTAAARLVANERGLTDLGKLANATALWHTERALRGTDAPTRADVEQAVADGFGEPPSQVVEAPAFTADRELLSDNLIAAKLLSRDGAVEARTMEDLLRLMAVIDRVAAGDPALDEAGAVGAALNRPTAIGRAVPGPRRALPEDRPPRRPEPDTDAERERIRARIGALESLSDTLAAVAPGAFAVPEAPQSTPSPGRPAAAETLRRAMTERVRAGEVERIETEPVHAVMRALADVQSSAVEPGEQHPPAARFLLSRTAVAELPQSHRATLESLDLSLERTPLPGALKSVEGELTTLYGRLAELEHGATSYTLIGSQLYDTGALDKTDISTFGLPHAVPESHGTIKPVGVGDLLVVRQQLKGYHGGEVAHVENVLKGESKKRSTLRRQETEETVTVEHEITKVEERDTQTTERFEMQREAAEVVKNDITFKAGLALSASFGPAVEFKAYTDFAMNHVKQESTKTATNYSKEVTSRASSKVSERHREVRVLRTLEIFEERNEHGVNNAAGEGHVVGVYQWIDKVYEAQVFNYGKRMMFDIMVPEPAAFWIHAHAHKPKPGATLEEPEPFTLEPIQITEANYGLYVERYQVAGLKPPPEPYTTVSKTFEGVVALEDKSGTKVADVPIPDGYQAITGHALVIASRWVPDFEDDWAVVVVIGKRQWGRRKNSFINNYYTLDNERGSVPLTVHSYGCRTWTVAVEVDCQRTQRAYRTWQLETHAAIQQAYLKMERDYRDELAALEVQAANDIQGRNPAENRIIERTELRKQAISVFTAQHYDLFGAIGHSPEGYPQPHLHEADAEGRYIRFFEQAVEWEHMMYLFYPYYWGRKNGWRTKALLQDVDTQFAEFLKAGSARVVVPIRPGFEAAVAHFLDTGEIWEGADPPTLTSPLYVNIIDEIKERTQAPGAEIPQGDPWEVRLPTTLVRLRPDDSLPTWTKQPDGTWLED
ncbi:hypothetical protein [Saccharothrix stipae]